MPVHLLMKTSVDDFNRNGSKNDENCWGYMYLVQKIVSAIQQDTSTKIAWFISRDSSWHPLLKLHEQILSISIVMPGPPITNAVCCNFLPQRDTVVHFQLVGTPFSRRPFFCPISAKAGIFWFSLGHTCSVGKTVLAETSTLRKWQILKLQRHNFWMTELSAD
jgi:hypothetical protein